MGIVDVRVILKSKITANGADSTISICHMVDHAVGDGHITAHREVAHIRHRTALRPVCAVQGQILTYADRTGHIGYRPLTGDDHITRGTGLDVSPHARDGTSGNLDIRPGEDASRHVGDGAAVRQRNIASSADIADRRGIGVTHLRDGTSVHRDAAGCRGHITCDAGDAAVGHADVGLRGHVAAHGDDGAVRTCHFNRSGGGDTAAHRGDGAAVLNTELATLGLDVARHVLDAAVVNGDGTAGADVAGNGVSIRGGADDATVRHADVGLSGHVAAHGDDGAVRTCHFNRSGGGDTAAHRGDGAAVLNTERVTFGRDTARHVRDAAVVNGDGAGCRGHITGDAGDAAVGHADVGLRGHVAAHGDDGAVRTCHFNRSGGGDTAAHRGDGAAVLNTELATLGLDVARHVLDSATVRHADAAAGADIAERLGSGVTHLSDGTSVHRDGTGCRGHVTGDAGDRAGGHGDAGLRGHVAAHRGDGAARTCHFNRIGGGNTAAHGGDGTATRHADVACFRSHVTGDAGDARVFS